MGGVGASDRWWVREGWVMHGEMWSNGDIFCGCSGPTVVMANGGWF